MAAPTPTPVPPDPDSCVHDNHECNPFCDIHNFEGGEMWKRIDTRGYRNVILEFELFAEGLSAIPHGRRLPGSEYKPELEGNRHLPYLVCKDADPEKLNACIDCFMMEQLFEVWYTTDFDMPYDQSLFPAFETANGSPNGGILRWKLAKAVPRSVLRAKYGSWQKVTLDFFAQDATDDNPNFGIWFRCLLDSGDNKVYIRNVVMKGQSVQ